MRNEEIRKILDRIKREHNIFRYEVAYAVGVNEASFSRWLRRELPEDKKQLVLAKIEQLVKERG